MVRLRQTPTRKSGNGYALQDLARPPRLSSTLLLYFAGNGIGQPRKYRGQCLTPPLPPLPPLTPDWA
jgi:hypothetical protein